MPGVIEAITFIVLSAQAGALGAGLAAVGAVYAGALINVGIAVGVSFLSSVLFKPSQPKPEDVQTSVRNPTAARQRHYGRVKTSGPWVFAESKDGDLHKVIALGTGELDAIEEYWVDDTLVVPDEFGVVDDDKYVGKLIIDTRLGLATETSYAALTGVFSEWDSAHRGDGVASLYAIQEASPRDKLAERFPNIANTLYRVVARGAKIFNPSTATTVWSDNAAAVIRDYATHPDGMRLPVSLAQTAQAQAGWLAGYERAALPVAKKAGGTEESYRLWGSYRFDERPADVLGRMLASCDARIVPTPDGGVTIDVGTWAEPTVTLDEDSITGFSDVSRGRDILTTANVISATFMSPMHDYQATDADQWRDEDDVDVRGEIVSDVSFSMTPSHGQARRLMKLAAYRSNPSWVGSFQCNLRALAAFGQRFVRITYPLFGIDEVFEVVDFRFVIGEGGILQGVTLQVQSMPSEAYAWNAAEEEGDAPISEETTVVRTIPDPANFTFTEGTITVAGNSYSVGVIAFDAAPSSALVVEGRYKKVSDTSWTVIPIETDATSAQTGVLDDGVEYEAQVRHVSITGTQGAWTDPSLTLVPISDPVEPEDLVSFTLSGSDPRLGHAAFSFTTQNDDHLRHVALYRVASGGVLDKNTDLVLRIPVTTAATTYGYVDGDSTRTNALAEADMSGTVSWLEGTGWTHDAGNGEFDKSAGSSSNLAQVVGALSGSTSDWRMMFDLSAFSAGQFRARLTGGTAVNAAYVSTPGVHLATLTANGGNTNFNIGTDSAAAGSVTYAVLYEESAACAPQGDWDYYAEPLNPSGVPGTLVGPLAATVI